MNRFLGILLVLFLSALWVGGVFFVSQELGYYSAEWYEPEWYESSSFVNLLWLFSLFVISMVVKWILKKISPNARYDFYCWLFIAFLYGLCFYLNRGWSWCIVGFCYGIPAVGINYIANGFKTAHFRRLKNGNLVVLIGVFIVGGIGEYEATCWSYYENEQYDIEVSSYTIPTFMDWQVECEIEVENKTTGKEGEFDFWFGNGPHFKLYKDFENDSLLFVVGDQRNSGHTWILDVKNKKILENSFRQMKDTSELKLVFTCDSEGNLY